MEKSNSTFYSKIVLERIMAEVERNVAEGHSNKRGLSTSITKQHKTENSGTTETTDRTAVSVRRIHLGDKSKKKTVLRNHELKSKIVLEDIMTASSHGVHGNNSEVDHELEGSSSKERKTKSTKREDKVQALHQKTINSQKFSSSEKCDEFHPVPENITSYPKVILKKIMAEVEHNVVNVCSDKRGLSASTKERHKAENSKTSGTAETAYGMAISLSKFYSSDKSKRDKSVFGKHAPQLQILLKKVKVEESEPIADGQPAKWNKRLRVRPPVEKIIEPHEEERKTCRIQEKVNYCELSSSDEEEPIKRKRTDRKYDKWSDESSYESMSASDDSSDEDYMRRKHPKLKNKSGNNSNSSIRNMKKNENLSEYEKLRNKNIEQRLAFLEALKFSELEEEDL